MRRARRWAEPARRGAERVRRGAERPTRGDDGSASIEFLTVGLLLIVPLVYLVIALAAVQGAALGVEGAARQAARVFVQSPDQSSARAAAGTAIAVTLGDYGVDAGGARMRITCAPHPDRCLTRRAFVTVRIDATVDLPLVPPALGAVLPLHVPVEATATEQVSRFWGSR
jgi:Flp pilus assembly protein TadG